MALKGTVKHLTLRLIQILNFFGTGVKSLQSCLTLCDIMDCSPRGSFVHGILQNTGVKKKKKKEYRNELLCPPPGDLPDPGVELTSHVSCIGRRGLFTFHVC